MIEVFDDIFFPAELQILDEIISEQGYTFGWKSHVNKEYRHWHLHFGGDEHNVTPVEILQHEVHPIIWSMWGKVAPLVNNQKLIQIYSNAYTYGTEGTIHTDSRKPEDKTVLVYLNKEWNPEWAGETIFLNNNEIVKAVLPKYGRTVIFPGNVPHAARSVSKFCPTVRQIIVFKVTT